jgi:hypothetical protein
MKIKILASTILSYRKPIKVNLPHTVKNKSIHFSGRERGTPKEKGP